MFKYLQRLPFIEINRYLSKAFKKELDKKSWVQNSKAAVRKSSSEFVFLKISQISQENTCVGVS